MHKNVKVTGGTVVVAGLIIMIILSIVGLGYLYKLSFKSKKEDGKYCVKMSRNEINISRLSMIVILISLALTLLSMIWNLVSSKA